MALRIIHALSVHRLTTSDLDAPLGVTAEELRDQLCLWAPLPETDAEFLANTVQVALKEIMRTVSGQYISFNSDNGQYYLNLKKDIDFDAKIAERGSFMEERDLNRYFFDALQRLLNITASVHVTGFRIWPYELPWAAKNVTRPGYLFFGAPDERSTAQPPRDFYIYILPPFGPQPSKLKGQSDEVIFQLQGLNSEFEDIVRKYAGAQAMAAESPNYRQMYEDKADSHLRALMAWLHQHFNTHLRVSYESVTRSVAEVLAKTRSSASRDAEDLLRVIASHLLAPHFNDAYPDYPAFTRLAQPISEAGRPASAMDAIRFLAGRVRTNLAVGVLDGLKLLDDEERIKPLASPYARHLLDELLQRGDTQVVNHGDIIDQVAVDVSKPVFKERRFKLEPEWVAVILVALVYDGHIVLTLGGTETLDAGNIERAALKAIDDLTDFRFYRRPKTLPLAVWTRIFDAFGLQSSLLRDEATRKQAVGLLSDHVQSTLNSVVAWHSKVQSGLTLWNKPLFTDRFAYTVQNSVITSSDLPKVTLSQTDLLPYLRKTKEFLEQLSRFNTPGKLHNLQLTMTEADIALSDYQRALRTQDVLDVIAQLQPLTEYLSEAGSRLPDDHPWVAKADALREQLLTEIRQMAKGEGSIDLAAWRKQLDDLRRDYIRIYSAFHAQHVLSPVEDDRRARLLRSPQAEQMKALARVDILNEQEFRRWSQEVITLPACREFHAGLLEDSPICPSCKFNPVQHNRSVTASRRLEVLATQLDTMQQQWHAALRQNLGSETAQASIRSMTAAERQPIERYLAQSDPSNAALPAGLVEAVNQALRGLKTVSRDTDDLLAALHEGGLPCTLDQLEQRFKDHIRAAMRGHDQRNTRLMLTSQGTTSHVE